MYGVIHSEIFNSTLMAEGYETTYVFMAMIALADNDDCVKFIPATLAQRIFMPLEKVEQAITRLSKPDPDSESKEFEGRRIILLSEFDPELGRGWFVVNREKYIEIAQKKRRRQKMRDLMREKRSDENANKEGNVSNLLAPTYISILDNKEEQKKRFSQFWSAYPRKVSKNDAVKAFNKVKLTDELMSTIMAALSRFAESSDWQKDDGKYIPYPATWLNKKRWEDEINLCDSDPAKGAI